MLFQTLLLLLLTLTAAAATVAPATEVRAVRAQLGPDAERGGGRGGGGARAMRCAPRGELRPEPQNQYSQEQVNGIFQHIKQRLEDLSERSRGRARSRARAKGSDRQRQRQLWDRRSTTAPPAQPQGKEHHKRHHRTPPLP